MRKQEKNEIKEANDFDTQRTRASNNREKKRPGEDEGEGRASQEDLRMYYIFGSRWLSWATAFTASFPGPSVWHPMSASQDTPFMRPGGEDACLRLDARPKAPYLETHGLARVFRGRAPRGQRRSANDVARSDEKKHVAWSAA
jgi:hypothetical protein